MSIYKKDRSYNAICDRCGFEYKNHQLQKEWTGLMVCKPCWEPRHPQDFIRQAAERETPSWTRPDDITTACTEVGDADTTLTVGTDNATQCYSTTLTTNRTVTLDTTGAIEGNQFIVTRTDGAAYTLDVGGLKTVPASIDAEVIVEYNGTSWNLLSYTTL
jgi:hypothetical protein